MLRSWWASWLSITSGLNPISLRTVLPVARIPCGENFAVHDHLIIGKHGHASLKGLRLI
jgi:hypothetical protein